MAKKTEKKEKVEEVKETKKNTKETKFEILNNKKIVYAGIALLVLIVIGVTIALVVNYTHDKKIKEKSTIDFNSETYKGKEITVKGNQVIITEENGSKTIETISEDEEEMTKATKEIKEKFKISDISIEKKAAKTLINGKIKATTNEYNTAVVSVKFYRSGVLAGTSSAIVEKIKKNDKKDFEITFVGDYSDCTYEIEVEYVD